MNWWGWAICGIDDSANVDIVNPLAQRRFGHYLISANLKLILLIDGWGISWEIALRWMFLDLTDGNLIIVQVMAWYRQAIPFTIANHDLICWRIYGNSKPSPRDFSYKDKTVSRQSYLYSGILVPGKTVFVLKWGTGFNGSNKSLSCLAIIVLINENFVTNTGVYIPLQWCHNEPVGVSNHQPHDCLLNRLFKAQIKENIQAPRYGLLWGEFTEFPAQRASYAENVSIWWYHHVFEHMRV